LVNLDISSNPLDSLAGLGPIATLEELWASNCKLESFEDIERELVDKKELTTVYFEGNPLQKRQMALYRNKVKLALPRIRQVDASECFLLPWSLSARSSLPSHLRSFAVLDHGRTLAWH